MKRSLFGLIIIISLLGVAGVAWAEQYYSGLVIDARELKIDPSKSPHIYDSLGREIYGTMSIDPDYVNKVGIVQYENSIYSAITSGLVGENPIVVRAIRRGTHPYKADVVVSIEDGKWIMKSNNKSCFLDLLKVVFVID